MRGGPRRLGWVRLPCAPATSEVPSPDSDFPVPRLPFPIPRLVRGSAPCLPRRAGRSPRRVPELVGDWNQTADHDATITLSTPSPTQQTTRAEPLDFRRLSPHYCANYRQAAKRVPSSRLLPDSLGPDPQTGVARMHSPTRPNTRTPTPVSVFLSAPTPSDRSAPPERD